MPPSRDSTTRISADAGCASTRPNREATARSAASVSDPRQRGAILPGGAGGAGPQASNDADPGRGPRSTRHIGFGFEGVAVALFGRTLPGAAVDRRPHYAFNSRHVLRFPPEPASRCRLPAGAAAAPPGALIHPPTFRLSLSRRRTAAREHF